MTTYSPICVFYIVSVSILSVWSAFPPSLRYPLPVAINKITDVNLTCDSENFNITLTLRSPFKGLLFAKDFAQECKSIGSSSNTVKISLPTSGCGVRLTSFEDKNGSVQMSYRVNLVIQHDRYLRQILDQERIVQCIVKDDVFLIKSNALKKALKTELKEGQINYRVGRMKDAGWSKELEGKQLEDELNEALSAARAWMEIVPEKIEERPSGTLQVGETALLTVKSTLPETWLDERVTSEAVVIRGYNLIRRDRGARGGGVAFYVNNSIKFQLIQLPNLHNDSFEQLWISVKLQAGIGWRVVECLAHDGLGDSSQKLLDEQGCPVDELLMPTPTFGPIRPIALMRHQEAVSRFAAFKFPDRDRLHLSCGLQLCRGLCPKVECGNSSYNEAVESRTGRVLPKDGEILDRLEVFNSVEVLAPEIDDLMEGDRQQATEPTSYPFSGLPGDRTFCVSPDKMAIAFCILGIIFLVAVVVAAISLLRAKRQGGSVPYYTRSLFSSSSGGSAFGSKLLLHDSPCLGQSASTSRGMQYGRIL